MSRPPASRRQRRIADLIRQEISQLLLRNLKDTRISPLTSITEVRVSKDYRYASVLVSVMGDEKQEQSTMIALTNAAGHIQRVLAGVLDLRYTPKLRFLVDNRVREGDHVLGLMQQLRDGKPAGTLEDAPDLSDPDPVNDQA